MKLEPIKWECPRCMMTIRYTPEAGDKGWMLDSIIENHLDSHNKPMTG